MNVRSRSQQTGCRRLHPSAVEVDDAAAWAVPSTDKNRTFARRAGAAVADGELLSPLPVGLRSIYFFLPLKIPDPLVCVAIAVCPQLDELPVVTSQPALFGPAGSNWSSL